MRLAVLSCFVVVVAACGGPKPRDVRVTPPPSDPNWYEVSTPEQIIPAGSEKMFCTDVIYKDASTAFRDVEALQGKFGHHVILLSTAKPKPEGTTYDCTDVKTMKDFRPFAIPLELPAGYAMWMPQGIALVVQMHYVNTSQEDILVKDYIRLKKVPESSVQTWAGSFAANKGDFMLPPNATDVSVSYDCTIDKDADLLLLGGHMHERGATFKAELGPDVNTLTKRYEVTAWKPDFRDNPPVELFTTAPLHLTAGMVLRTTCSWNNDTSHVLTFPEEMCSTFGVLAGTKESWVCNIGTDL